MDVNAAEQILEELVPTLEVLDTQITAITRFLRDKGIVADEEFRPYLEQATSASSVRWRAVGLRVKRLLSLAEKQAETKSKEQAPVGAGKNSAHAEPQNRKADETNTSEKEWQEKNSAKPTVSPAQSTQTVKDTSNSDGDTKPHTEKESGHRDAA
jgi:hypothetical protein